MAWSSLRMNDDRLLRQAVHLDLDTAKRKPGRPRKTGTTLYVKAMGMTWEEALQLAANVTK